MKIKKLILASAFVAFALHAFATDVYVYKSGKFTPVAAVGNIYKIVRGDTGATLIDTKGDSVTVEYSLFNYIVFHRYSDAVGIADAKTQTPEIKYSDGVVSITGIEASSVALFSTDGTEIASLTPASTDIKLSTYALPKGVYIVRVTAASGKKYSKKIIRR